MEINDALDALHLSNPTKNKRRRLSGLVKNVTQTIDSVGSNASTSEDTISVSDDANKEVPILRRTSRRKTIPVRWNPEVNISKQKTIDPNNIAEVEKYYLNNDVKKPTTSLETIFEESPTEIPNKIMGKKKFRRFLQFDKVTQGKINKRRDKAQKISTKKKKTIKATLKDLHKRLALVEEEDWYLFLYIFELFEFYEFIRKIVRVILKFQIQNVSQQFWNENKDNIWGNFRLMLKNIIIIQSMYTLLLCSIEAGARSQVSQKTVWF